MIGYVLGGIGFTLAIAAMSLAIAVVISFVVAVSARTTRAQNLVESCAATVRFIPPFVTLPAALLVLAAPSVPSMTVTGSAVLGVHLTAYTIPYVTAAWNDVPQAALRAARALGLPRVVTSALVRLPASMRHAVPGLSSAAVLSIKDSALASVIAVPEVMYRANIATQQTYDPATYYLVVGCVYALLILPVMLFAARATGQNWLLPRWGAPRG